MSRLTQSQRRHEAKRIRHEAAEIAFHRPHPLQTPNHDEQRFGTSGHDGFGNFSKGLPHHGPAHPTLPGLVKSGDYRDFVTRLNSGDSDAFNGIPNHVTTPAIAYRKLTNPQAGLSFDLEGPDAQAHAILPAPAINSSQAAAEMAELYWMTVLRDAPFDEFTDPSTDAGKLAAKAATDLSTYPFFQGLRPSGKVTPETLFRSIAAGMDQGNYVSQFLLIGNVDRDSLGLLPANVRQATDGYLKYGAFEVNQRQKSGVKNKDYLTDPASWHKIQNGEKPALPNTFEPARRFITTPRDIATYVHFDALYEAYLNACWYLLNETTPAGGPQFPFGPGNPYADSHNQEGFGTFGGPHILSLVTEVATRALKAVWYQKWLVHRRLRPEAFGGRVHFHLKSGRTVFKDAHGEFIHPSLLDDLAAGPLAEFFGKPADKPADRKFKNYLLPMAFPEGSPMHPSYGAGHATVAAACITVLKAFFDEDAPFPSPVRVVPGSDGATLEAIPPAAMPAKPLTVGGELNKIAVNISVGRNMAGVHYWSDDSESRRLGEQIGMDILQEQSLTYNERRGLGGEIYFTFLRMDGKSRVTIVNGEVSESPAP